MPDASLWVSFFDEASSGVPDPLRDTKFPPLPSRSGPRLIRPERVRYLGVAAFDVLQ